MAQFIAFSPDVEVSGRAIAPLFSSLDSDISPMLKAHGLPDMIDHDAWYAQQQVLNVYRDIATAKYNSVFNLVGIGMKVPDHAWFPPNIDSIPSALQVLNVAYQQNHRGGDIGEYLYIRESERRIRMVCRNPYPSDFDYGLIYGLVRKFRPGTSPFSVTLDPTQPTRKQGGDSCTFHVTWGGAARL